MKKRNTVAIRPTCDKCGHTGTLRVNREALGNLWKPLLVRRIFILAGVMFTLGVLIGRGLK